MRMLALFTVLGLLAGCGSATATRSATGASSTTTTSPAATTAPLTANCATTVASTLGTVAARVYHEAATGGNVAQAVHRVQSSSALAGAIGDGNAAAARAALRALLPIRSSASRSCAAGTSSPRRAPGRRSHPSTVSIPGTSATFVLSTQSDHAYLQVVQQVTGAQVLLLAGDHSLAGTIGGTLPRREPRGEDR